MKAAIFRATAAGPEYYFEEGCHILELLNSERDPSVSIARARVQPGQTTRWHKLENVTERYLITSGQGIVEIEGLEPAHVSAGDAVLIPAETAQRITCSGDSELVFYAICSPRFTPDCYRSLEA